MCGGLGEVCEDYKRVGGIWLGGLGKVIGSPEAS